MNSIIATTPEQMLAAKPRILEWIDARQRQVERERAEAEALHLALLHAGLATKPSTTMLNRLARRERFYCKVRAAIEAGYVIIPPFDLEIFAIRTARVNPNANTGDSWTVAQRPSPSDVGLGEWVNPTPDRIYSHTEQEQDREGKSRDVRVYENGPWKGFEFPVRAMKPQLIEATTKAMGEKIFDALGIAPAFRSSDPIIAGQIRNPNGSTLTFFVAWWLDDADL